MKLHIVPGYIQDIYLVEYPKQLLLLDGCCRADVSFLKEFITQKLARPLTDLKLILVSHMHPDHAGAAHKLRKITGCKIATGEAKGHWYSGLDGILMHISDILLTRYVASKKNQKQRWLWYARKLNADIYLQEHQFLPGFEDWQVLFTPGHTDRDISLHHLPSNRIYIADLVVAIKKGFISPFPVFYPNRYRASLQKIAALNATSQLLAHGGEVQLCKDEFSELIENAPTKPITHWRAVKSKLKKVLFS